MKKAAILGICILCAGILSAPGVSSEPAVAASREYRHFFGVCNSRDSVSDILRYARQMGHYYVVYKRGMEDDPNIANMRFFLETPEYRCFPFRASIDTTQTYTPEEQAAYERYVPWRSRDPFPR